jgi:hypothetical protein
MSKLQTLPLWMASLAGIYLFFCVVTMHLAGSGLVWLWFPGWLVMEVGASFLKPIGLTNGGDFFVNPTVLGWIVIIAAYSGATYGLGCVIRWLANGSNLRD